MPGQITTYQQLAQYDDWGTFRLGDVAQITMGQSPPSSSYNAEGIGLPFFQGKAEFGFRYPIVEKWCSEPQRVAEPSSILVSVRAPVGDVNIANTRCCIGRGLASVIELAGASITGYLYFYLQYQKARLESAGTGSTFKAINKNTLFDFSVTLPPLPEQRRIAAVLNTIQDAIAAQEDVVAAAKTFKRSLMQRLFTYGAGREPAETKETEIGEIPAHWEVVQLGKCAAISSGTTPSRAEPRYWANGTVPWVKTGEVNYCHIAVTEEHVTDLALQETSLRLYPAGTLILAMYGQGVTRGKVAILDIPATINQACAAILADGTLATGYLYHYFTSAYERLRSLSHGTQQPNLNAQIIRSVSLPVAPIGEQHLVADFLDIADSKIAAEEDRLIALQALFKSMLHQLMTGLIRLLSDEGLPLQ